MTITLADAKQHLNVEVADYDTELEFFVTAANVWVATQVDDTDPEPVQLATRELVRHWWRLSQLGPANLAELETDDVGLVGLRVPPIVHQMLGPYLTAGGSDGVASPQYSFPDAPEWPDAVTCW